MYGICTVTVRGLYGVPGVRIFAEGVLYRASESQLGAALGLRPLSATWVFAGVEDDHTTIGLEITQRRGDCVRAQPCIPGLNIRNPGAVDL